MPLEDGWCWLEAFSPVIFLESQPVFIQCLQSTSWVPGSGLGIEGGRESGHSHRALSPKLTVKAGRLDINKLLKYQLASDRPLRCMKRRQRREGCVCWSREGQS